MPFIDSKITVEVTKEKREILKAELGKAIAVMGKGESYLMLGFEDNYNLYMGGKELEKGAFVAVSLLGNADSSACEAMTGKICQIYERELGIPGNAIYVTYQGFRDWGWNGRNF